MYLEALFGTDNAGEATVDICKDLVHFNKKIANIFFHPVIQTFLALKWKKIRKFYYFHIFSNVQLILLQWHY